MSQEKIIVYASLSSRREGLQFFCPWGCRKFHLHGVGEGFRSSHCPFHEENYFLICIPIGDPRSRNDHLTNRKKGFDSDFAIVISRSRRAALRYWRGRGA